MKPKTLPIMELLAEHSAIKSQASLFKTYSKIYIENVCLCGCTSRFVLVTHRKYKSKKLFHQKKVKRHPTDEKVTAQRICRRHQI